MRLLLSGIAVILLLGGAGTGYAIGHTPPSAATFETAPSAPPPSRTFAGTRISWSGSGLFRIGEDAPAGRYLVTATGNTFGCAWARLRADDGKLKSTIDGSIVNRGGFDRFTIASTDRYVRFSGDCTWALDE